MVRDYAEDPELLALLNCWKVEKRCPEVLVDWLLDRGENTAAECARWANGRATDGGKFCCPADFYGTKWGWFRDWRLFGDCVPNSVFNSMYPNAIGGDIFSCHHPIFEDAVIALLDNWIVGAEVEFEEVCK